MIARLLYSLLLYLGTPLLWLRLWRRSRRQPEYLQHLGERWGRYWQSCDTPVIWIHAVSVGETRAAEPLLRALRAQYPRHTLLLTGMTPTGREAGRQVYGDAVLQVYLPYDYPGAVGRFLRHFQPQVGILMETEIWPNLLAACQQRQLPVFLANARLSERSARGYARFGWLARPAFASLTGAAAQTTEDARRLAQLGVGTVKVCGNLKFDVMLPEEKLALGREWRAAIGHRPVFLAASTREGEEALVLDAWRRAALDDGLLVLVPRHPQRFDEVAALLAAEGWRFTRRSEALPTPDCQVWLGDSMGEMAAYYTLARLAFVGGSLLPLGGQNLIEASACGCPVLVGPHTFNFAQATQDAIGCGAAGLVENVAQLAGAIHALFGERHEQRLHMAAAALDFAAAHGGATVRTLEFISQRWDPAGR